MLFILEVLNLTRFQEYACWVKFKMVEKNVCFFCFIFFNGVALLILAKFASMYCL